MVSRVNISFNIPSRSYHSIYGRQISHPQGHPLTHGLAQSPCPLIQGGLQLDPQPQIMAKVKKQ